MRDDERAEDSRNEPDGSTQHVTAAKHWVLGQTLRDVVLDVEDEADLSAEDGGIQKPGDEGQVVEKLAHAVLRGISYFVTVVVEVVSITSPCLSLQYAKNKKVA